MQLTPLSQRHAFNAVVLERRSLVSFILFLIHQGQLERTYTAPTNHVLQIIEILNTVITDRLNTEMEDRVVMMSIPEV